MKKQLLTLALLVNCGIAILSTNAQFSMTGQFRPRTEFRNGFKTPITDASTPALFTEQRTRLNMMYKSDKFDTKVSIQDVRIWGEVGQINKSDQLLSVNEAYADFKPSSKSTFRIGRQTLIYDDHKLIGSLGWAAQARAFDAIMYKYKDTLGNQFDIMASFNQTSRPESAPEPAKLTGTHYATTNGGGAGNARIFNLGLPLSTTDDLLQKDI